jgi:trans-4-hydroxy-L-proline dehydratase
MNERIQRLRSRCLEAQPSISGERASLLTDFYQSDEAQAASSTVVLRALSFKYLLQNQSLWIGDDELIVGERGPFPKATPTYPELCCHSVPDLQLLNSRPRTRYAVGSDTQALYSSAIIPFWESRSIRNKVFQMASPEWQEAFDSGVFTEFMEQRAPGHAVLDDKIYHAGLLDFIARIQESRAQISASDLPSRTQKLEELQAMEITCMAMIQFATRHADLARKMAEGTTDSNRRGELLHIAAVCDHVPANAPRTFHEALQAYWFIHLGVIIELNEWDSFNPGRLDQNLYPFYAQEISSDALTQEHAQELLSCFWIKFSQQPAPPKVGVTDEGSATYNDFTLINAGGLTPTGDDGVNELSYLMLDVIEDMQLPYTGSCIQLSKRNPDRFLLRALEVVRKGFGQPSIFNTDAILQQFLRTGKSIADARSGGPSGCVTISAFGKESCVLTGYMNWPKILDLALHDGKDPQTGHQLGPKTGEATNFKTFEQLLVAYECQLNHFVDLKIEMNDKIERLFADDMPAPFLSVLVDDCIQEGEDYNGSGPRYPTTYIQGVGLGTTTDALTAIQTCVFDNKTLTMEQLLGALQSDFVDHETVRRQLLSAPKYGNDDARADTIARRVFDIYFDAVDGRPNTKGGSYRVNLLPTTVHVFFGRMVGASADGRQSGTPLSDGISPTQGADTHGPTATLKSAGSIDHVRTGGTLLNQRFLPDVLKSESDLRKVAQLVRGYFRLDGHHIQFNVVDSDTLLDAQQHPEKHRDLIVRVAGYSDYFGSLDRQLQDEIIARTAHGD